MKTISTIALILATAASPALAQTADDIVIADQRIDPDSLIVTATGAEQHANETGQAVTVITRAEIEQKQSVVVSDLLQSTPGVTFTRAGGIGTQTSLRIRGAEGDQTLVLIDGVRVGDPSAPGGGYDFGNLLVGNIDRIELVRGPNSVPWGSQALGGVVNILTARPEEGLNGRASAEYGRYDTFNGSAQISGKSGRLSASIGGNYYRTDGISAFSGGTEADGYRQYGANGRLGFEITPDIDLDLRGRYADSKIDQDGFMSGPPYGMIDTDDYSTIQEVYGYAGVNVRLFDGRLKNRLAFTIADVNRDIFNPAFNADPSYQYRGRTERFEYQGDLVLNDSIRAVFGAESETTRLVSDDGFSQQNSKTGIDSIYGQLIVKPIEILTITGGVRHDDHEDFGGETTFGANAVLTLGSGTVLRANYGEGFKAPTLYQLLSDYGNLNLQPERSRSYDIGFEQTLLDGAIVASVTAFQRKTRNQIDFFSCFPAIPGLCDNRPFGVYDNIAEARAKGLEFLLDLKPVQALNASASYTFVDSENRSAGNNFGNELALRPRHSLNFSADYAPFEGLSVGGSILLVSDSFNDAGNFSRLESYVLTGLRAAYTIDQRFTIFGRVDNLFDVKYQTVTNYGTLRRAAYVGVRAGF